MSTMAMTVLGGLCFLFVVACAAVGMVFFLGKKPPQILTRRDDPVDTEDIAADAFERIEKAGKRAAAGKIVKRMGGFYSDQYVDAITSSTQPRKKRKPAAQPDPSATPGS